MISDLTQGKARSIVRTLRAGVPSPSASRAITVGTSHIEAAIRERFLDLVNAKPGTSMLLVEGDWGFGKSHVQMLCSDEIQKCGVPFIYDRVNGKESSLAHIHRSVPRWMLNTQFATARGLIDAVEQQTIPTEQALRWCEKNNGALAEGLRLAIYGEVTGWLKALGLQYGTPDYPYQHMKALRLLLSVANLLRDVGYHGLVLLLDEVENVNQQYDIRGRRRSYDTLGCLRKHTTILPILFVTRRFLLQVEEDKKLGRARGWIEWTPNSRWFVEKLSEVEVLRPPALDEYLAGQLVQKMKTIHDIAYDNGTETLSFVKDVLRAWRGTSTRSVRLLVRLAMNELDLLKFEDVDD